MLSSDDILTLQNTLPFWTKLSNSQKDLLIENTRPIQYSKGEELHCNNCECMGVLVILEGTIRVYITSEEGREVTLYRLDGGDVCILSASCILQAITFDVSLQAESACRVLQISASVYSRLNSENVYAELFAYKLATERFSEVMWAMQQILFTSFDKRLASFLLDESLKTGSDTILMTHEQLAKHLGSAREVVSRMLKYFVREGYVTLSRGGITLLDKKRLRSILAERS